MGAQAGQTDGRALLANLALEGGDVPFLTRIAHPGHALKILHAGVMQHVIETVRANRLPDPLAADSPALDRQNVDNAWKLDSTKA